MQELKFDQENDVHFLDVWPKSVNVGNFVFVFEVIVFIIVLGNSGEQFEITLRVRAEYILNLVEKGRFGGKNSKQHPTNRVTITDNFPMTNKTCDN
ncbi:hypothetical protein CsSME_00037493 [Camellia sinensis var. sinensis]